MSRDARRGVGSAVLGCLLVAFASGAAAHGGVVLEDDVCLIKIGYLEAHFKIFQPHTRGHREYCEDLPGADETVFVMEYVHEALSRAPLEFRIVRNVTGLGRFTRERDLADLDLDALTLFHLENVVDPDVFTAVYDFDAPGDYIGIVTARPTTAQKAYTAVFPFRVGFSGLGHWPWFGLFVLFLLANLWLLRGRLAR